VDDFYIIAEGFGIEDEREVDRALSGLRVEPVGEADGVKFRLRYRPPKFRPVDIHFWTDPDRVREEREEAVEQLGGTTGTGVKQVQKHLGRVVEVVALELGWSQLEEMAVVLAGQVAEYFAVVGNGLIRDQNDDWWTMKSGAPRLLVGPPRRK
jgi:hypothetical protein